MKFTFNKTTYNEKEKEWIKQFLSSKNKIDLDSKFENNNKNNDYTVFDSIQDKEAISFFINEYINFQINNLHATANKNKKDQNDMAKIHMLKKTNGQIADEAFNNIIGIINHYPEHNNKIISILSSEDNLKKINEIAIDKSLNNVTIFLINNNINFDQNKLLNLSIRNGNQEIFEKLITNFKGKKEGYDNLSDSPFFWQPLLFSKNKDFSAKYIYDQLLDNNFKIGKVEILKMIELSKQSPQKLKYYSDLDKRIDNKSTVQRSLKF